MAARRYDIAVIGAGVVGMATALQLVGEGHRVRVIDPVAPGESCSYGNAGVIEASSVIPLANPGTIAKVPRMLLDRRGPLKLRWRHLPRLMPWLLRFLMASRREACLAGARALVPLATRAVSAYQPLLEAANAQALFRYTGWSVVYDSEASLEASAWEREFRSAHGIDWALWDQTTLRERVPALSHKAIAAVHYPQAAWCVQPLELVQRMAQGFLSAGGELVSQRVERLVPGRNGVNLSLANGHDIAAERVVVAAGAWSGGLARQLGDRVPLDTERGYHNMLNTDAVSLPMPLMLDSGKFVVTPMKHGIRLAGTAEMGGLKLAPDYRRADVLIERAREMLPALPDRPESQWMGFRPTLPDSLPVLGPSPGEHRVIYAFGHQHLGLTLAGVTARLLAQWIADGQTEIRLHPYRVQRFQ